MSTPRLRYADALRPTMAVLLYIAAAYIGGFLLLLHGHWWSWPLGVIAVAHAMVIARPFIDARYRLQRIVDIDSPDVTSTTNDGIGFIGVLGVSFLTPI